MSFGIEGVQPWIQKPPIILPPEQDSGKGGVLGLITNVLSLGSLIPGPQQPFIAAAAGVGNVASGAMSGNYGQMANGINQVGSNNPMFNKINNPEAVQDTAQTELQQLAQQWMMSQEFDPKSEQNQNPYDYLMPKYF